MRLMTFHALPELQGLTAQRRRQIVRQGFTHRSTRALLVAAAALALVNITLGAIALANLLRLTMAPLAVVVGGCAYGLIVCLTVHQVAARLVRTGVRGFLLTSCHNGQMSVCPDCGYDQRGNQGHHCPECGQDLRLRP